MSKIKIQPSFDRTCELIYSLASTRINEKFEKWKNEQFGYNAIVDFYPSDRKLFGNVLKGKRKKDNPYLLTPKLVETIAEDMDFNNENEIFWGKEGERSLYIEDFFTTLLLEVTTYQIYKKYFIGTNLTTEREIKDFYINYIQGNNDKFLTLMDDFIDFTRNSYDSFEIVGEIGEMKENCVALRDGNTTLTFHELPKKIRVYVDKVFIPFVSGICLENLMGTH